MNFILPNEQNKYPRYCNVNNLLCLSVVEGFVVGAAGVEFGVCAEVYYVALLKANRKNCLRRHQRFDFHQILRRRLELL